MRLVVLGGSGRTGVHLVEQALKRGEKRPMPIHFAAHLSHYIGHNVSALVRDRAKLPIRNGLDVCEGVLARVVTESFEQLAADSNQGLHSISRMSTKLSWQVAATHGLKQ